MKNRYITALRAALLITLPVLAGFLFLGAAYGIIMRSIGLGTFFTFLSSWMIFAGSMQYVAVTFYTAAFDPLGAFVLTLMVNARHIFYGLSLLDRLRGIGRVKPYVVFALCDETFSILVSTPTPEGVDDGLFAFFTALLNRWYWIIGSVLGALAGDFVRFDTRGLDFALTALFVVIFINQWTEKANRPSSVVGVACSVVCLLIFGPSGFIIPAMILMLLVFAIFFSKESEAKKT